MFSILIIEDDDTLRLGITQVLKKMGYRVYEASGAPKGIDLFKRYHHDLVITDYKMEPINGLEVLKHIKSKYIETEVIIITAYGTPEIMMEAEKLGASEFIFKPFPMEELEVRVKKTLKLIDERKERLRFKDEIKYLREELGEHQSSREIIGKSDIMESIFQKIQKIAPTDSSVLIYGESGTGKELVARAIHFNSKRKHKPFRKVNCGALAKGILESELFGHEKGAFTGAISKKLGRFELAHTGSIFLDEIGEVPLEVQVKLLRVLQEKEFERVGGEKTIIVDVRIIAATNKNLKKEVEKKNFREDLFYRLHIIPIELPPLRDRMDDIPELVDYFIEKLKSELGKPNLKIQPDILNIFMNYNWPGNIRELENVLERAAVLCDNGIITTKDIPSLEDENEESIMKIELKPLDFNSNIAKLEFELISRAMKNAENNKTEAAKLLGIKTSTLYYKMEKYNLL